MLLLCLRHERSLFTVALPILVPEHPGARAARAAPFTARVLTRPFATRLVRPLFVSGLPPSAHRHFIFPYLLFISQNAVRRRYACPARLRFRPSRYKRLKLSSVSRAGGV